MLKQEKQFADAAKQSIETDKRIKKTEAMIDRLGKRIGEFGNNDGRIVEQEFYDALYTMNKTVSDVTFKYLSPNYRMEGDGIRLEIDVLLYNENSCRYYGNQKNYALK